MSASPVKADMVQGGFDVRFVPLADIAQAWARFICVPDRPIDRGRPANRSS